MRAPAYDWVADISLPKQVFLKQTFPDFWKTYVDHGYIKTEYQFATTIDEIYTRVHSLRVFEKVDLPSSLEAKIRKLKTKQFEHGNLCDIVTGVPNYHIDVLTENTTVVDTLASILPDELVNQIHCVDDVVLKCGCNAVVLDDITGGVTSLDLENLELHAVPHIRRSVINWKNPIITNDSEAAVKNFVLRSRPCILLR